MANEGYKSIGVKEEVKRDLEDLRRIVQASEGRAFTHNEFIQFLVSYYRNHEDIPSERTS